MLLTGRNVFSVSPRLSAEKEFAMVRLQEKDGGVVFFVKAQPRSSRSAIIGEYDGKIKISLKAAPVDDAANVECCRFLAKSLGVASSRVRILSGHSSRIKRLTIDGMGAAEAATLFGEHLESVEFDL